MNRWRQWSLRKKILSGVGGFFLLLFVLCGVGYAMTDLPSPNGTNQASSIRYADGSEIGRIGAENRRLVSLSQVSDPIQKAVLAAEDRGFYQEPGISPRGIFRALVANLKGGGVQQGGSTITQQYAKNAYLSHDRSFTRKVKEFFISLKLSQKLSKDQILENYLNTIYFGRGASGVEVAANTYFNKHAKDLTVAEGAVLAASIRSPAAYDPSRHSTRAEGRWNYVLDGMVKKGWLSQDERAGQKYPAVLEPGKGGGSRTNDRSGPNGFVLDQVEEELAEHGFTEDRLAQGGYVVQTTIRKKAQLAAIEAMKVIPDAKDGDKSAVQGALVAIKPGTGEVYAYYGGRNGNKGFDYASSGPGVQPGSSFKPFTLAAALDQGIGLGTRVDGSSPQTIGGQEVRNDEGDPPLGKIDLVKATELSVNTAYYNLAKQVRPDSIAEMAHRAGIPEGVKLFEEGQNNNRPTLGITLGIYGVHVIDQANAYATFANGGEAAKPFFVKSVRDRDNNTVYGVKQVNSRAFSADVAADATYALQQVVEHGTGTRARLAGRPSAGKTGTTQQNKNAWFCGYTPQLSAAVWVGRADGSALKGVLGSTRGVYGGTVPAGIWKSFMETTAAAEDWEVTQFPPRANVGSNANIDDGRGSSSPRPSTTSSPSPLPTELVTLAPEPSPASEPPASQPPPASEPPPASVPPPATEPPPSPQPSPLAS
ncbi:MAG: penicillin-binding protein [Frankiaceae bacterium]|nr:penicillin-binding protein [Frankiaceae bacterium]